MTTRKRDNSLGIGVYFAPDEYVGIMRRLVILVVDLAVLIVLYFGFTILFFAIEGDLTGKFLPIYLLCVWLYMTVVKASRIRTVGYWLTGSRILNLRGKRPSVFRMTFRMVLWAFGPFNLLFDLLWAGIDDDRQTLRDRFAGTCVVKNRAEPVGSADVHLMHYFAGGYALAYPRVMGPSQSGSRTLPAATKAT